MPLTKEKAKKILSDGMVKGKKLTKDQKKFFNLVASGKSVAGKANDVLKSKRK